MEDEFVKVTCTETDCKFNLYLRTNRSHCKLKYITIIDRTVGEHGVPGTCMEMELR
jgi:hypothetical protein